MKTIRQMSASGKFYTDDKNELLTQLKFFEENSQKDYTCKTRAVIVPHAGYVYSGQLASAGFQYLDTGVKNVFIIAPPHYVAVRDVSLSGYKFWQTPLGQIEVNQDINKELIKKFDCNFYDEAFEDEHSVEVQVPFIQSFLPNVKIIPILTNNVEKTEKIIAHYYKNPENAFVISSDLSHFYSSTEAKKIDSMTAEMIETKTLENFNPAQACGSVGVRALVDFAKNHNYSLFRIGLYNSGDVTGDETKVVGYGSWLLFEGSRNEFIKKYFSDFVIDVCKKSILARLNKENLKFENVPAVFGQSGACFVTLEIDGELRGCIGSIIAHRILIDDLAQNAQNSAFSDPRFVPLKREEFDELSINVSLLSEPQKMHFKNESELLNQIKPFLDGIIIKDGHFQAVYLPSVWEQLPDKVVFLNSLKMKAGLREDYFSPTFEAYKFNSEYIEG